MDETILKSKWYYRLLTIIYIGLFLIISLIIIYNNFELVGSYQTDFEVECYFGNKETFFASQDKNILVNRYAEVPNPENWHSSQAPDDWSLMDVAIEGCDLTKLSAQEILDTGLNIFDVKLRKVNVVSYSHAIFWSIFSIVIVALIFEVTRRIFYFIVLGVPLLKK